MADRMEQLTEATYRYGWMRKHASVGPAAKRAGELAVGAGLGAGLAYLTSPHKDERRRTDAALGAGLGAAAGGVAGAAGRMMAERRFAHEGLRAGASEFLQQNAAKTRAAQQAFDDLAAVHDKVVARQTARAGKAQAAVERLTGKVPWGRMPTRTVDGPSAAAEAPNNLHKIIDDSVRAWRSMSAADLDAFLDAGAAKARGRADAASGAWLDALQRGVDAKRAKASAKAVLDRDLEALGAEAAHARAVYARPDGKEARNLDVSIRKPIFDKARERARGTFFGLGG